MPKEEVNPAFKWKIDVISMIIDRIRFLYFPLVSIPENNPKMEYGTV
jgi:hypothetical protein